MRILAVDTAAPTATVCLTEDTVCRGEYTIQTNAHSTTILPMIASLLKNLHYTLEDCDLLAVSAGPGSFTGIRIGVSTVKGLAFSGKIPCVGVSALESIAYGMTGFNGILCPAINARREHVYAALFHSVPGSFPTRLTEDMQISVSDLCVKMKNFSETVYVAGDGYEMVHRAAEEMHLQLAETPVVLRATHSYGVAMAGMQKYLTSEKQENLNGSTLVPIYLRKSQAEREREERLAAVPAQTEPCI